MFGSRIKGMLCSSQVLLEGAVEIIESTVLASSFLGRGPII